MHVLFGSLLPEYHAFGFLEILCKFFWTEKMVT